MKKNRSFSFTGFVFAFLFLLATVGGASAQNDTGRQTMPAVGSVSGAVTELGSSIFASASSALGDDPYAQFRGLKHSNDGLMTEREEITFGNELHTEFSKKYKYVDEGQDRATRIGWKVAKVSGRPGLPYKFFVIKDKQINAFSAPGGHIYITTALMELATDEELGAVLAHEIGHVTARHSLVTLQQTQAVDSLASIVGAVAGIIGANELGQLAAKLVASPVVMAHNREQEREADYLGAHIMSQAGYDPQAMVSILKKMQQVDKNDGDLLGSFFSDHPDTNERIANTEYEVRRIKAAH
jgi:predicted Zn-dependent protease